MGRLVVDSTICKLKLFDTVYFTRNMHIVKCKFIRIDPHEKEDIAVCEDSLTAERYMLPISKIRKWVRPTKKVR